MPDERSYAKGYLKGFEDGLKDAWEDLIALTMKGYTSREIQILAKSHKSDIPQKIEMRKKRISRELDVDLEAPEIEEKKAEEEPAIQKAPPSRPSEQISYEAGTTVIVHDHRLDAPISVLKGQIGAGRQALCIVRTPPETVRKKHGIDCQMVWLTRTMSVEQSDAADADQNAYVSPTDLPKLTTIIKSFSTQNAGGSILLEGLEYLVTMNDAKAVIKFLSGVRDQIYLSKAFLMLPIDPTVFDEKDLKALEREGGEE
ncbi:MAG: DUF835 domain-containing protein [Methanomassiliicoccales archaeon]|nr:DUF835 domain-containing protein [Methanomassiliicoccales archaeon]